MVDHFGLQIVNCNIWGFKNGLHVIRGGDIFVENSVIRSSDFSRSNFPKELSREPCAIYIEDCPSISFFGCNNRYCNRGVDILDSEVNIVGHMFDHLRVPVVFGSNTGDKRSTVRIYDAHFEDATFEAVLQRDKLSKPATGSKDPPLADRLVVQDCDNMQRTAGGGQTKEGCPVPTSYKWGMRLNYVQAAIIKSMPISNYTSFLRVDVGSFYNSWVNRAQVLLEPRDLLHEKNCTLSLDKEEGKKLVKSIKYDAYLGQEKKST